MWRDHELAKSLGVKRAQSCLQPPPLWMPPARRRAGARRSGPCPRDHWSCCQDLGRQPQHHLWNDERKKSKVIIRWSSGDPGKTMNNLAIRWILMSMMSMSRIRMNNMYRCRQLPWWHWILKHSRPRCHGSPAETMHRSARLPRRVLSSCSFPHCQGVAVCKSLV